ncbi:MAG TPA: adenylosuccinate lyase [Candidatus Acidoferrales bacterium]|nr:adenylosuccinate lyase [Candidatus Acidoferrales bacterium]
MIKRYSPAELSAVWSEENKFRIWLDVEIAAMECQAQLGRIPTEAVSEVKAKAKFDVARIDEIERTVKHDVIAFLTNVSENVGPPARFVHLGMTSSDVLDTASAIQLKQAGEIILKHLLDIQKIIGELSLKYKDVPEIGRTHGIHAEPITFGLKIAVWYDELGRDIVRLKSAIQEIAVAKISGAVGTYSHISPEVEKYVAKKFGLQPSIASTQVIQRDRHAQFMTVLAVIAGTFEKMALEVRHMQRTEVLEAEEPFTKGQKGSSAMPHKRNPVNAERICGMARLVRSYAMAALENQALWHERDISHSSVERVIFPDATLGLDFMILESQKIFKNFVVYPENMKRNLQITHGLFFSEDILLKLVERGMTREQAYAIVQRNAMQCWETGEDFLSALGKDREVAEKISPEELAGIFSLDALLKNVDYIYKTLGLKG